MGFVDATLVLIRKNTLLSLRDAGPLIVTLSSAFFSMLILYFSQISINNGDGFDPTALDTPNPVPRDLSFIPRCIPLEFEDCYTLAYAPESNPAVRRRVAQVASRSNIPDEEVRGFPDSATLNKFLFDNPNRTQAAYIFEQDNFDQIADGNISFVIQYNETLQQDFPLGLTDFHAVVVVPNMVHAMNLVMMEELTGKNVDLSLKTSVFPHPNLVSLDGDGAGLDAFGQYGPLLTFATYFLVLVFFLYKIVEEKENGLRDAMKLAGQYQSQHIISWSLPYIAFMLVQTLLLIAFGHAFDFKYFTRTDFGVYFLTMFIFSLSVVGWTFPLAVLTKKSQTVSVVGFNLFIIGYLVASFGSIVYGDDISESVHYLRQVFAIAPSTVFVKALTDGTVLALQGSGLSLDTAGTYTDIFPVTVCWRWMFFSGLIAFLIGIYLDNVIPTEHGAALSPFYPFQASYWGLGKKKDISLFQKAVGDPEESDESDYRYLDQVGVQSYDAASEDVDVRMEREAVARGDRDTAALVVKNISKSFKTVQAVDDVSFSVKQNSAFALLGHNGAGKTTLQRMLITATSVSAGDAFIYGLSVREDKGAVRKLLGVCPQFDIFWHRLTGAEHVMIFGALKGLNRKQRLVEAKERLADVHLTEKANVLAGSYSGGMQRRLSVALSLTGDPKIVFLDECTSGADPLVRRDLWGTIERAKKGRVIFLITHSIAEAQHIAGHNAIGIMAKGKLRVLGNALHLKTKFGAGYRVLVVLRAAEAADRLAMALNAVCPGTTLTGVTEGKDNEKLAEYSLPRRAKESEVLDTVSILEEEKEEYDIVEYSLNSTTLGEVFKKITSLSEDVHEDESGGRKRRCCF